MSAEVKKASTDQTFYFNLVDDTTGSAKASLTITAIDATYIRTRRASVKADCTALASADSAHTDNAAFEVDSTNAPGLYRVDFPDAAFASSSDVAQVILVINHASIAASMQLVDLVVNVAGELAVDSITASVIAANAITGAKFAANAINASAVAADAIDASAIAAGAITAAKFASGAIDAAAIASDAIDASAIAAGAITAAKFASDAITASVIAANAITAPKFAGGAINASAIAADAITATKFAADAINASAIAADAIDASAIAANAITAAKIADGAIDSATFTAGALNASALNADAVTEILLGMFETNSGSTYASSVAGSVVKEIADNAGGSALTAAEIADAVWDEVQTGHISAGKAGAQLWTDVDAILADTGTDGVLVAPDAIGASAIAANAITAPKFAGGAINASAIASDAITATKFAADAINASAIAADAIDASAIAANAITAAKIADAAIDNATFASGAIGSTALAADVVTDIFMGTALTESYATDGSAATPAQLLYMIWAFLAEKSIASTTLTANQLDGATPAMTFSLSDATSPVSITRAS